MGRLSWMSRGPVSPPQYQNGTTSALVLDPRTRTGHYFPLATLTLRTMVGFWFLCRMGSRTTSRDTLQSRGGLWRQSGRATNPSPWSTFCFLAWWYFWTSQIVICFSLALFLHIIRTFTPSYIACDFARHTISTLCFWWSLVLTSLGNLLHFNWTPTESYRTQQMILSSFWRFGIMCPLPL